MRGPIGGWFAWDGGTPALLVGGGTGVVPLVAMVRHARATGREDLLRVAVSARSLAELPYAEELQAAGAVVVTTREAHGIRPAARLTAPTCCRCGSPGRPRSSAARPGSPGRRRTCSSVWGSRRRRCGWSSSAPAAAEAGGGSARAARATAPV